MAFNPDKHRKTKQRIAELESTKQSVWSISRPQQGDYIQCYGNKLEDLDLVNVFVQRDGKGQDVEWLLQPKDPKEEEKIFNAVGLENVKSAIVIPCFIRSNKKIYLWLGKQPGPKMNKVYPTHLQIREIIPVIQHKWQRVYFDNMTKEYVMSDPKVDQAGMKKPEWPDEDTMKMEIAKALGTRLIEEADHEIIKRTTGEIE